MRRWAARLLLGISTTLALASLFFIFFPGAHDQPTPLNLPPFEKELHLIVTAKWAPNDCVDVTVVTNLPEGTLFVVGAQPRAKPEKLGRRWPVDQVFNWNTKLPVVVTGPRIELPDLFCGLVKARGEGHYSYTNGLLLAASVSASSFGGLPFEAHAEKQALRIGRFGTLLKGPLARPYLDEGIPKANARSNTFVLKPLPLLPGEDEKRRPFGSRDPFIAR